MQGETDDEILQAELRELMRNAAGAAKELGQLNAGLERGLRRALAAVAVDGRRLSDVLNAVGRGAADRAFRSATRPVTEAVSATLAGAVMQGAGRLGAGALAPFLAGGVLSGQAAARQAGDPVPAAGVSGPAARPVQVTFNVTTPDVEGFRRSQSQIAARLGQVLARGQRNL